MDRWTSQGVTCLEVRRLHAGPRKPDPKLGRGLDLAAEAFEASGRVMLEIVYHLAISPVSANSRAASITDPRRR